METLDLRVVASRRAASILLAFGYEDSDFLYVGKYKDEDGDPLIQEHDVLGTSPIIYGENSEFSATIDQLPKIAGEIVAEIGLLAVHLEDKKVPFRRQRRQQIVLRTEAHPSGPEVFVGNYKKLTRLESEDDLDKTCKFLDNLALCVWNESVMDKNSVLYRTPSSEISQWAEMTIFEEDW